SGHQACLYSSLLYGLLELKELKDQLEDLLSKRFILYNVSPELNKVKVNNKYPLSCINYLFDYLQDASLFSKIDLRSDYHQLKVRASKVLKTTFRTRYGQYEFLVMSLDLTSSPVVFVKFINAVSNLIWTPL
ncbi:hypothetical protein MTR67_039237, partial [Solanum verrucosum]